ncbi:hypothetical protein T552_02719 [Pneumocystis carinii B80]|uniref:Topoisomerase I damage affected protein 2 n=1 Tax=Pneumocystis carinii (strain B80) TaxID=1408658 RepID=A0A0W4ZEB1_PNEC8|nr:hypothetical protein T552_02719 [Pneumocystis carinii B80]KTW26713.1 hypothetical protein T552_02719 [Pneumocystis carinii B80]
MMSMTSSNSPILYENLKELCESRLCSILGDASYTECQAETWNTEIIHSLLEGLKTYAPRYKWIVTSSIIEKSSNISLGIHSVQGAYWNNEKDGMLRYEWSNQYLRVVLGMSWIQV